MESATAGIPVIRSVLDEFMNLLNEMENVRRRSEEQWKYTSSRTTKEALARLYGTILALRRIFDYPDNERLVRAYFVIRNTPFSQHMVAFRCPIVRGNDQDRASAMATTTRLREGFRSAFTRFFEALVAVYRADDIATEQIEKTKLESPQKLADYLKRTRDEAAAFDIATDVEDPDVKVDAPKPSPMYT
jgi:hypothetical protein